MKAAVYNNKIFAGTLEKTKEGYFFTYAEEYFSDAQSPAISLSLTKNHKQHVAKYLFPFFSGLLSEGVNKQIQCRTLRIDEKDDFTRLLRTANTETIGAITIKPLP